MPAASPRWPICQATCAHHRRARRRRQHDEGGHQGLCDRLGRPCGARAVRGLHRGSAPLFPEPRREFTLQDPVRRDRPLYRRPAALSVRLDGHDGGRPRGRLGRRRGAPAVPRDPRHHGGHGEAGLRQRRRHADQGSDPRDDRPLAAAGPGADRAVLRHLRRSPGKSPASARWARCCSARSSPACSSRSR